MSLEDSRKVLQSAFLVFQNGRNQKALAEKMCRRVKSVKRSGANDCGGQNDVEPVLWNNA